MSRFCFYILQESFGKTKARQCCYFEEKFIQLRGTLDDLICRNYTFGQYVLNQHKSEIFYCTETLRNYPVSYTKTLPTTQDTIYIFSFLEKLDVYLNFLENNVCKFPVSKHKYNGDLYKRILQIVFQLKKREKMIQKIHDLLTN